MSDKPTISFKEVVAMASRIDPARVTGIDFGDNDTFTLEVDVSGSGEKKVKVEIKVSSAVNVNEALSSVEQQRAIIAQLQMAFEQAVFDLRVKAANLPKHVSRAGVGPNGIEGIGGNLAFVLRTFLNGNPICDLSRRGLQSVQFELPFKDLSVVHAEAYTYKQGIKAAITGLEENVFFSLFNDRFLGISPNKGHSIIEGDTKALSEIIGDNAPRLSVLNDIIRNLSRMEFSVPGAGHELHGRVFPVAICPDEGAGQTEQNYMFKFEVSEWIPAALLKSQFERIDLRIFWSIKTPAARRLYACMKSLASGYAPRVGTLCERIGLPYPTGKGKSNTERRAKSKAILKKYLQEVSDNTDELVAPVGYSWFKGDKVQWKIGAKQIKNRVTEQDEDAEYAKLYRSMPPEAKAMYKAMKDKGASRATLQGVVKRYHREGGHLHVTEGPPPSKWR